MHFIKTLLRPLTRRVRILQGNRLAKQYLSAPNCKYLLFAEDIGSAVWPLSFLNALKERFPQDKLVVLTKNSFRELCGLYAQIDELIILPPIQLFCICAYLDSPAGKRFARNHAYHFYTNRDKVRITEEAYKNDTLFPETTVQNAIYSHVFEIAPIKTLTYGVPSRVDQQTLQSFIDTHGIRKGGAVILIPHTVSGDLLPDTFWETLASRLIKSGLQVFTNAAKPEEAIPGTQQLFAPIAYMPALVCHAGYAISIQTGLGDLLRCCGCPCSVIRRYGEKFFDGLHPFKKPSHGAAFRVEDVPSVERVWHDMSLLGKDPFIFPNSYAGTFDTPESITGLIEPLLQDVSAALGTAL